MNSNGCGNNTKTNFSGCGNNTEMNSNGCGNNTKTNFCDWFDGNRTVSLQ